MLNQSGLIMVLSDLHNLKCLPLGHPWPSLAIPSKRKPNHGQRIHVNHLYIVSLQ